jgi:hypothetical protein
MIHEHEATELASAAIDFGLTPDVQRELDRELAECPICAERAAAYREQIRFMQRLPVLDASDATRRRVTAAALSGRTSSRSPLFLALAAALLVGLLLATTFAVGAWLNDRRPLGLTVDDPVATPGPSAVAVATASPHPSQANAIFPDPLPTDAIVEVVSDNLRVRSEPRIASDSFRFEPLLRTGDRLFVIEGPVVASAYDWYRVAPVGTDPSRPWTELPSGWVARGDHDGTPWIEEVEARCPVPSPQIGALNRTHPLERLACFGADSLTFSAVVSGTEDRRIATEASPKSPDPAIPGMEVVVRPGADVAAAGFDAGHAAILSGSFDRSDPAWCREPVDDVVARLACRTTFVVTSIVADSN